MMFCTIQEIYINFVYKVSGSYDDDLLYLDDEHLMLYMII